MRSIYIYDIRILRVNFANIFFQLMVNTLLIFYSYITVSVLCPILKHIFWFFKEYALLFGKCIVVT